jgi:DNA polymerase II small subunit
MEKQDIVKMFLEKGLQIDPQALEYLYNNQECVSSLIEKLIENNITFVTLDAIRSFLTEDVIVVKEFKEKPRKISVEDVTKMLRERYEKISQILSKRFELVNPISIGKITRKAKNFSLICLVRDKKSERYSLVIEDGTGETEVFFDKNLEDFKLIVPDEVVGLVCENVDNTIFVRKVVYPDIPFRKEVNKAVEDVYCLFFSNFCLDSEKFNEKYFQNFLNWLENQADKNILIFILGGISSKENDIEELVKKLPSDKKTYLLKSEKDASHKRFDFEDPVLIKVKGLTLLLSHGEMFQKYSKILEIPIEQACVALLRKRHLNPIIEVGKTFEDVYLLETVPDIIACGSSDQPSYLNYKSTTIISCGNFIEKPIFWMINLKTREIFKIDFS